MISAIYFDCKSVRFKLLSIYLTAEGKEDNITFYFDIQGGYLVFTLLPFYQNIRFLQADNKISASVSSHYMGTE